jgi:hypothetical protein
MPFIKSTSAAGARTLSAKYQWRLRVVATTRRTDVIRQLSKLTQGAALGGAMVIGLAACASTPLPNDKLAVAKASVQRAEQSGAPELAPVEMAVARDKLARAEKAAADREAQPATSLAEQANVDAQLAEATAQQKRSEKAAMEFDANMQALRGESMRTSQSTQ